MNSDEWAALVKQQIDSNPIIGAGGHFDSTVGLGWIQEADRIEVLAGRQYIEPLRDMFAALDADVAYPFQKAACAGVGEQMGWLRSEVDGAYPEQVNEWTYCPDAPYNGDVWTGDGGRVSLLVRRGLIGAPSARVSPTPRPSPRPPPDGLQRGGVSDPSHSSRSVSSPHTVPPSTEPFRGTPSSRR